MAFTIPNHGATDINQNQSIPFQADIDALVAGIGGTGVVSGCAVTWTSGFFLNVTSGFIALNGSTIAVAGGSLTVTQSVHQHRLDLVTANSSGVCAVTQGVQNVTPTAPDIPANAVLLAIVFVPSHSLVLQASWVVDKRVFPSTTGGGSSLTLAAGKLAGRGASSGSGNPEALTLGTALTLSGTILNAERSVGLNILDYGAVEGDDCTVAIQAAVDDAITTEQHVIFPAAQTAPYYIGEPVLIHAERMPCLLGEGGPTGGGTRIAGQGFIGPLFHVRGATPVDPMPYTTSLATGSGQALTLARTTFADVTHLDLIDVGSPMLLNGLSQLAVGLFIKPTAYANSFRAVILKSKGSLTDISPTSAFTFELDTTGHLIAGINVAGTLTEMTSAGVLTLNQTYFIEVNYNGSAVKAFYGIPGATTTQCGTTTTVSGTVRMGQFEQVPIGGERLWWPHGPVFSDPMDGALDSIRISSVSRHQANFTAPTAKQASDANTLVLENFDNETDDFSIVFNNTGYPVSYLPKYAGGSAFTGSQGTGFEFGRFDINASAGSVGGSGLFLSGVVGGYVHDVKFTNGTYGINTDIDVYTCQFERLDFLNQFRVGIAMQAQNGINHYSDFNSVGQPVLFIGRAGSGVLRNFYPHGGQQVIPILLREGTWTLDNYSASNEDADASLYQSCLYLAGNYNIQIVGGVLEAYVSSGVTAISFNGGHALTLMGAFVRPHASATEIIDLVSNPSQPIVVLNGYKDQAGVPWCTDSTNVVTLP